jgi:hypothetical protein
VLQSKHGFNEFDVSTPESAFIKLLKTIYESPMILLRCGSAAVSAMMGNRDDAISITVAILIIDHRTRTPGDSVWFCHWICPGTNVVRYISFSSSTLA